METLRVSIPRELELLFKEYDDVKADNIRLAAELREMQESHKMLSSVSLIVAANKEIHKLNTEVAILKRRVTHYQTMCKSVRPNTDDDTVSIPTPDVNALSVKEVDADKDHIEDAIAPTRQVDTKEASDSSQPTDDAHDAIKSRSSITPIPQASDVDDGSATDEEVDDGSATDEEVEVIEQEILGDIYFVSDDENKIIYERILEDGEYEIGDEVGVIGEDGSPVWN